MRTLRRHRAPIGVLLTLVLALWQIASPFSASAATFYWDINGATPGAGGPVVSGTWGLAPNWSSDAAGTSGTTWNNSGGHTAVFSAGSDASGASTITVDQGGAATNLSSIVVEEGKITLSPNAAGDTLDFSSATGDVALFNVESGSHLTVNNVIAGTSGLGKVGNGTMVLGASANTYTGQTTVNGGALVFSNQAQLGTSTSGIAVGGISGFGFTGGTLWMQGETDGMTLTRNLYLSGRGPNTVGGALVVSGNNNVVGGSVIMGNATETRLVGIYGTTTFNGPMQIGTGVGSLWGGGGNMIFNGLITAGSEVQDRNVKFAGTLASTMVLNNNANTFLGGIRIDSSASVQVSQNGALGNSTLFHAVDMSGGLLEVRTDAPDFNTRNVRIRGNTNTIYADRAIGGSGLNQVVAFGNLRMDANATLNVITRSGYDVSFTGPSGVIPWINGGNIAMSNVGNGLLLLNGSIELASAETSARTITFGSSGSGDILLTGSILQPGTGAASITKTGQGTLWIQGGATTATGITQISQGTLAINRFGGLSTGQLNIGNATTTAGILQYLGAAGTGAGETTTKSILLNTTTANVVILADQAGTGTSALVLNGTILGTVGAAGDTKTLYLGGINEDNNEVRTALPATAGTLNLAKVGSGTWMLSNTNAYTGSTTIADGILKLAATDTNTAAGVSNVIGNGAVIFNVDALTNRQTAGGMLEYIGHATQASTETLGTLTATAGAGTVQVTHGFGPTSLVFGSLGTISGGTGVNFVVGNAADSISITGSSGFLNAHLYYNGSNFAFSDAGVLRAPVYGTDAGFVTSAIALTAAAHNEITGSFNTTGMTISSLKIAGGQTLTLDAAQTLTIQTGANSAGGILVTGGAATITGGTGITTNGTGDMVVRVNGASDSLTLASLITSTTTGGLTKNGAGTLFLEGLQAYTGATTINEGSLVLRNSGRLGGSVNNNLVIRQDGTLDLNGISAGVGAFNGSGLVTNTGAAATFTIGNNNQSGLFSGLITGNLSLTKVGTGTTMSLTGLNTYNGVTTISGGVLVVNSLANIGTASSIGTGDATSNATNAASLVFNGGTLLYTGANGQIFQQTNTPSVSINRLFTLAGNGTIDSTGTFGNSALGASSNHAALIFNNTADVAFSGAGNRTLTLTGTSVGWNEMRLHLVDNPNGGLLNVTKAGAGLWVLNPSSANTYTGQTSVTGGALQAVDGVGLSSGSNLLLNGGVFQSSGTFTRGLGTGAGQVQLTGNGGFSAGESGRLVVAIGGTVSPTNLVWGSGGFFAPATTTLILNSTSSLWDVELVNNIDLGATNRIILVENNGNTHMDFATLSGVLSGTAGFTKQGASYLVLGDNNTYAGNTVIDNGSLVVTSIGAAGDTATSIGTNVGGGVLNIGAGGNTANLVYTGAGETVTRTINLVGTGGTQQIEASGTGALIINTLNHTGAGAKTLGLRGYNMDFNEMAANLADNGGILTVTKSDGGTWILSGNNTFTGNLNINSGFIGATTGSSLGSIGGTIAFSNGGLFAHGGDITVNRNLSIAVFTAATFSGENSIVVNGGLSRGTGNGDITLVNSMASGKTFTINGDFNNAEQTANRSILIRGTGHTIWNGVINNNNGAGAATTAVDINLAGILTLGGATPNTYTGGTTLTQGKLIINKAGALGTGVFNYNGGVLEAGIALTAGSAIANNVTFGSGNVSIATGTNSIEFNGPVTINGDRRFQNDLSGGATVTFNGAFNLANDATNRNMFFEGSGNTIMNGVIQDTTATASVLHMRGTGNLTITNQATYRGATNVSNGNLILSGANGRLGGNTTAIVQINSKGTLTLDNSAGNPTTANRLNGKPMTMNGGTLNLITAAGGSSESIGALTVSNVLAYLGISGTGAGTLTFASVAYSNSGSMLDLGSIANLGTTNKVIFTTNTGFLTNNINVRTAIGGKNFATYDAVNGVTAFTGYNVSNNLNTAAVTDTMKVTANANLNNTATLNALLIDGSGLTVSANDGMRLTLTAAGVLVTGGTNTIDMTYLTMAANGVFQVDTGATLDFKASMTGGIAMAKALDGTMLLSAQQFYNSTTNVMGGTLKLNAGLNTLYQNQLMNLGAVGLLDLNGNTQFLGQLNGAGLQPGSSASVTNSSATHVTLATNFAAGSGTVGGAITGNLSFARSGGNTLTLESANTYTGATLLNGGTTTLRDNATLANTTSIDINYATLFLANNDNLQIANDNRVNDAATITLRGGTLTYTGRANDSGSERFGALTIAEGSNTISANTGGSQAYHYASISFADFIRVAGTTVNFTGTSLGLGGDGNAGHIYFDSAPIAAENGALGGWAIANTTDYASYNTTLGIGAFGQASFPIYDTTFGTGKVTNLVALTTTDPAIALSSNTVTSLLRFQGLFTHNVTFGSSTIRLNLEQGGILRSNEFALSRIGTTATRGVLTAGGNALSGNSELVVYNNNTTNFTGAAANSTVVGTSALILTSVAGIVPGMTVTGPNIPVGTVVLAVDGPSLTITLSNNATLTANAGTFTFYSTVEVNSVIADTGVATGNGTGTVSLVKGGGGALVLSAQNTYTGGTFLNGGITLLTGGVGSIVLPSGNVTLNGATLTMVQNAGQINSSNLVTLNGSSTLNLVGNNTLAGLVFNNNGGTGNPTVNTNGVLTLTGGAPITATSTNVSTTATINGTIDVGSGVKTFHIEGIKPFGEIVSVISPTLNIIGPILGTATTTINKTGDGLLQLGGQSTFGGGLNVLGGGLVIAANSTVANVAAPTFGVGSGPVGTGTVTMAAGTRLLSANNSPTVSNAFVFQGTPIFDNTGLSTVTLNLTGPITLPNGNLEVNVIAPNFTASLSGTITNSAAITSVKKTGFGNLTMNFTNIGSSVPVTMEDGGTLGILHDGDGTGGAQVINFGAINFGGVPSIIVGRAGTSEYFNTALNKTIAPVSISSFAAGMTVTANNLYSLRIDDSEVLINGATFTVNGANNSNTLSGLVLNGALSGAPAGITKTGNGTLYLGNATNSFGGASGVIAINQGVVAAATNEALGNLSNIIRLSPTTGTSTFRADGTFATSRVIQFGNTANTRAIEVTQGNVLTLNSAFDFSTFSVAAAALVKNDLGTLQLNAANTGWDGVLTINQGAVMVRNSTALGSATGATVINTLVSQLQLGNNVVVNETLNIAGSNNQTWGGIDSTGVLRSVDGTNTWQGTINLTTATTSDNNNRSALITVDAGSVLNITGNLTANMATSGTGRDMWWALGGAGTGNITGQFTQTGGAANNYLELAKFGTGTWNLQAANAFAGHRVFVIQGTLALNGAGTFGVPGTGGGANNFVFLNPNGTLLLDNTTTNTSNRLSNRSLDARGGNLTILGNATGTVTETTTGTVTLNPGALTLTVTAGAGQQTNFTAGAVTRAAGSTVLFRGTNLGNAAGANVATIQFTGTGLPAFVGQTGAVGTTNKGILPWGIVDNSASGTGVSFATADSATGRIRALDVTEFVTSITGSATAQNVRLSTVQNSLNNGQTQLAQLINSLQLNSGGSVTFGDMRTLTLDSGGILALAGNGGIHGGLLTTTSARELIVHTAGDLNISSAIVSSNGGLTKSGNGMLTLSSTGNNFTGNINLLQGTLKLAGGDNTIFFNNTIQIQGGTLDLNGNVQHFASVVQSIAAPRNANLTPDTGGIITNTAGTQATLAIRTGGSFAGSIQGNIAVLKSTDAAAFGDWNIYTANTFTGPLLINGGRAQLLGSATFSNASAIELSQSTLLLSNNNVTSITDVNLNNRINDSASILMRGAMFQYRARFGEVGFEKIGDVTLAGGNNFFDVAEPGTGVNESTLTMNSLTRQAGSRSTVRFMNVDGQVGNLAQIFITNAPTLTNNLIGGWAVYERDFASYTTGAGVGALNGVGYAGYSNKSLNNPGLVSTDNVRLPTNAEVTTLTSSHSINSLAVLHGVNTTITTTASSTTATVTGSMVGVYVGQVITGNANITNGTTITAINGNVITLSAQALTAGTGVATNLGGNYAMDLGGNTLRLTSGGLILSSFLDNNAITVRNGSLTAGTAGVASDLYLHALGYSNNQGDVINRDVIIDSSIVDNGGGAVTLVVNGSEGRATAGFGTNEVFLNTANTYTGGTFVNAGKLVLNVTGANGTTTTATGTGNVTIVGGASTNGSTFQERSTTVQLNASNQIHNTATVTIGGGATLNLNGFSQTVGGLVFNNTGGNTPTLTTGTNGILTLNGNVVATSQNIGNATVSTMSTAGTGFISLGGATRTFDVSAVKFNGQNISPLIATLNVSGLIRGLANEGIIKTGDGLLQLSAQNTFTGGVDLQQGGIAIAGSSTPSGVGAVVTSGPLGTGTFKIGANTYLTSTGTQTLANNLELNTNLTFRGANSLTFNGNATLTTTGTFTVNVEEANFTAVFNGLINANSDFALVKDGFGTLRLGNNYNQVSAVTLNQGTLELFSTTFGPTSPVGNAGITMNGGLLSLRNNGGGGTPVGVVIAYNNDLTLGAGLTDAQLNIGNVSAGTNNLIQMGKLTTTVNNQGVSLTAANGYNLRFVGADINTQARFAIQSGATLTVLLSNVGVSQSVTGPGSFAAAGDNYVNTGAGTLVVGVGVKTNTTTNNGGTFNFAAGNNTFIPLAGTFSTAGFTQGGLMVRQTSYAGTQSINSAATSGVGPSAAFVGITPPADTAYNNHPPVGVTALLANTSVTHSGLVEITSGGTYGFRFANDDQGVLFIDGVMVLSDNVNGGGQGITERGTSFIELTAGFHQIVYIGMNQGSGGGFNLLYSGPDTAGNGSPNGFQALDPNKLYYATNLGNAGNGFLNAAIIDDDYNLAAAQASTLDGQGTHFNLMFGSLTLGAGSTLTVANQFGTGYYGVVGTTTIGGAGTIVNPTTGTLYLAGGVNDGGFGLTKNGAGSLYLGTSTNFTGTFNMAAGFTLLAATNGLSSGTNIVTSGAQLDLYGNSSHGSVTLNGTGVALLATGTRAALWNSLVNSTGTLTGNVTIGSAGTNIGGIGDIVLSGTLTDGGFGFAKIGTNTLTLSGNNAASLTGVTTISNGILKLGSDTALGTVGANTVISSGAVLDLNGRNIAAEPLSVAGLGFNNRNTSPNTLGAIINSSNTMATFGGPITMTAATSIGTNRLNANSGVATSGDITLSGAVTGAFALTKVGNNTLFVTGGGNTYNGMVINGGTVVVSGAGQLGTGGNHSIAGYGQPTGLLPATTLQLDNTGTASNSRLGGRALSIRNGHLIIDGHASTAVNENLGTNNLTISLGHNVITLNNNGGTVTLSVNQLIRDGSATLVLRGSDNDIGSSTTRLLVTSATANAIIPVGTENTTAQFTELDTSGILPWILIDNGVAVPGFAAQTMSFARYDAALGLTNISAYAVELPVTGTANGTADVNLAVVSDFVLENTLSADQNLQSTGVNSITFNDAPSDAIFTIKDLQVLTLDSGGILALSSGTFTGNGSLNVAGNRQFVIHTIGASTVLNIDVEMGGRLAPTTGGLAKTGEGTLILGERNNYTGSTVVNQGTLQLNGGDNTIFYTFTTAPTATITASTPQGQAFAVAPGGTVDLNGTDQTINNLQGNGGQNVAGAGGIITNTSATASDLRLVVNASNNWQGSINGNVNLIRSGGNTVAFYDNNAYTGTTLLQGGVLTLIDQGRLSGTSGITVSRAVLRWDDTGMQQVTNRLGAATPITLNGGALSFIARVGTNGVMDVGNIHLAGGANYINATPNSGTATIRMGGLTRTANSTITFAAGPGPSQGTGTPGANPFFYFDSAPTLTNGIIGGWAYAFGTDTITTAGNIEFATYDASTGVRMLTAAQVVNHFNDPNANVRLGGSATVKAGGAVINSLSLNGATLTVSFAAANDVLNITSGGLLGGFDNTSRTIGSLALPGIITAGGVNPASDAYLFVTNAGNNMQINSIIADNPTNGRKVHLVLGSAGRADNTARVTLANANTYTGTTYIQGVRVDLANTTGSGNAITGDLILSGGIENQGDSSNPDAVRLLNRASNQIADTANVTIQGGGSWELFGFNETINNLTFQNEGGSRNNAGPRVQTGVGVLTLNGNVAANNLTNASAIPLIAGNINFGADNALTVTVDKVDGASVGTHNQIGLTMNVNVVSGNTLTKQGAGMLAMGGQSNSVLQLNVAAGDLTLLSTASYVNTTVNLAAGTRLDMRGTTNVVLGNVTGSGTIYNFHPTAGATLVTGGANADATFSGLISGEFSNTLLNVTKVGTGTWTLTADNSQQLSGTLLLLDGGILLNSTTARLGFATQNIGTGGVLTLDNSTNALNFRMGGPIAENSTGIRQSPLVIGSANVNLTLDAGDPNINRNVNLQGGTINFIGGSSNVMEAFNQIAMTGGASTLNMTASSAETVFITNTLAGVNNGILYLNAVGSGAILGGTKGANHVNFAATTSNLVGAGGGAGTRTMSIRPDIIGSDSTGTGFVFHDADGLRLLTASEYKNPEARYIGTAAPVRVTTVAGAAAGDNIGSTENVRTALNHQMDNSTTLNSLTLQSGGGISSAAGGMLNGSGQSESEAGILFNGSGTLNTLTISSGGLLAFAGNTGIQGGAIAVAADRRLYITTLGDLTIDSYILGAGGTVASQGIVKSGAGTLTLGKKTLSIGALSLHEGTLVLNGGDNTIMVAPTAGAATQLDFNLNGGLLDLNGNDQAFGRITTTSADVAPNGAGDITNTGAPATLYTSTQAGSVTYSGNISGALNLVKAGANTWTLTGSHSYTGATIVRGGIMQLRDDAVLSGTSSIELNYSALFMDNAGWSGTSRLPTGVNVVLRGGNLRFATRQGVAGITENLGTITFAEGMSRTQFDGVPLGGQMKVNSTGFVRTSGDGTWFATPGTGSMGRGNSDSGDQSPQLIFAGGIPLINGIIGGWAIQNGDNWLTYQSTVHASGGTGVGAISDTGAGFVGYDEDTGTVANFSTADSIATRNMRIQNGTYTVGDTGTAGVANNFLLNSLAFLTNTNGQNLVFADNLDTLYLTAGAFLRSGNVTNSIGGTVNNGRITSGVVGATGLQYLYMHNNQSVMTLNSQVVDNSASAPVRLVLWSGNSGRIDLASQNQHTGGTVVNGNNNVTTVQLNIANAIPAGGLTINDTNVITNTGANVVNGVHASNIVTINGGGTLNLTTNAVATNTLAAIVFNNPGSSTTPQVIVGVNGSTLILTAANAITSTSETYANSPTIAVSTGGNLQFSASAPVITVNNPSGIASHGLLINAVIQTNVGWTQALTKDGNGMLSLAAANTFAQGIVLKDGGLVLGNNASLGTGKLTVGDGVAGGTHTLMTNGAGALTIANQIDINEDLIIGGTNGNAATGHNLTTSGAVALGSGDRVITVESPTVTFNITGVVSSTGGELIKDGDGILQLSNAANTRTGDTRVKRGLLRMGAGGTALANSHLAVESAGTFDMNGNSATVKSLSGEDALHGGVITNSANNTQTLTVGDVLASVDATFAGIITDNRAVQTSSRINVIKNGDSRQKLTGVNTYGGTTVVNSTTATLGGGGHLQVGENGVGQTGTGATTVSAGATLSGSGLVNGTPGSTPHSLASGARLSPGDNYGALNGTLTFNGNLTLNAGSQSVFQLTTKTTSVVIGPGFVDAATSLSGQLAALNSLAVPAGAHDALQINGTLNVTGGNATPLFLVQDNSYLATAIAGDVFDLIDWTVALSVTTFNPGTNFRTGGNGGGDIFLPTLNAGYAWDVSAFTSHGILLVVPEPSRAMLLFGGLLLLLSFRRRRMW